jgi:hypothetical protein
MREVYFFEDKMLLILLNMRVQTHNLCSQKTRDHFSRLYKKIDRIVVLYITAYRNVDRIITVLELKNKTFRMYSSLSFTKHRIYTC